MKKIINQLHFSLRLCLVILFSASLVSCGQSGSPGAVRYLNNANNTSQDDPADVDEGPEKDESTDTQLFKPSICSKLSISNIGWPSSLTDFQINAYALAMNISGSFEGPTGWKNLTNNFDGQGVSLGLFNQNLGQGSLQPMMLKLRNSYQTKMKSIFTKAQYDSVNGMLTKWGGSGPAAQSKATPMDLYDSDFSDLDDPDVIELDEEDDTSFFEKAVSGKNAVSVSWAVNNLYNGKNFKPEWKTALINMAGSKEYVTVQIGAAKAIHDKALGYMNKFNFKELRAFLFFFDIVVQNGGITSAIEKKYVAWEKNNKKASETAKLKKMLEYRLTIVKKEYVNDVKARKTAVIDGIGTVHGAKRDFKKEFCSPVWTATFPPTSLTVN